MIRRHGRRLLWCGVVGACLFASAGAAQTTRPARVPGVVIDHSPASSGLYVGSPGLAVLPGGEYLASHDFFGPRSREHEQATTVVFRSQDHGATWAEASRVDGMFWASLFSHRNAVYLLGTDRHHGRVVIRRSRDGGASWTTPHDPTTGVLTPESGYHTAPVPVVLHDDRLWRGVEDARGGTRWGERYRAGVMSIPVDADLLDARNWIFSNWLSRDFGWLNGDFGGWLEGNAVVSPQGRVVNVLRVDVPRSPEVAAIVEVSSNGRQASFDPTTGFVRLPGGAKKFTIRQDRRSGLYWSLATVAADDIASARRPAAQRNTLALTCSPDLRNWTIRRELLHHTDADRHGFQYVDWQFEGDDIIAVCRTAFDDDAGGAHNHHDANYLTFHRIRDFRSDDLTRSPSTRPAGPPG